MGEQCTAVMTYERSVEVVGAASSGSLGSKRKAENGLDLSGPRGWGECPVCDQFWLLKSRFPKHDPGCC